MNIAIIDTGITEEATYSNCKVKHFSMSGKELVNKYQKPVDDHGTECFKELMESAGNVELQILDLNILEDKGNLEVESIIRAIEKAIEERVDLINISLGVMDYSKEMYDVCDKAVCNNIVVVSAASHTNTISFPADFNNVICVKVDQSQTEKIKKVDDSTLSVSMRDFIMEGDGIFDFSSSSLASARLCGYFSSEFAYRPLDDKYKILSHKYGISLYSGADSYSILLKESSLQRVLQDNRVAVVVYPSSMLNKSDNSFFHKNIIAYFDHKAGKFYSIRDNRETKDFDLILIINTSYNDMAIPEDIKRNYKGYEVFCVGNFLNVDGNKDLQTIYMYKSTELSVLDRPVIAIAGLCSGLGKWDVQLSLLKKMKEDGLEIGAVSNNPIGLLYDINVFAFPNKLKFPDVVYSINRFMYLYEINRDIDAWLVNIGGAIDQINMLNTYNFGKFMDAYLSAANIDIVLLCINPSVDIDFLKLEVAYLYKHGVEKVIFVLSHNDINATTMDYKDGLQTYYVDEKKYNLAFEYLKENMEEMIFGVRDIENGRLYDYIIEILS